MAKLIRFIKRWLLDNLSTGYCLTPEEENDIVNGRLFGWYSNIKPEHCDDWLDNND